MCSRFPAVVHPVLLACSVLPAAPATALRLGDFNNGVCHVTKIATAESDPDLGDFNNGVCHVMKIATAKSDPDLGDFNNGVCHVMKIAIAESDPDLRLSAQHTICFSSFVLATMTLSLAALV